MPQLTRPAAPRAGPLNHSTFLFYSSLVVGGGRWCLHFLLIESMKSIIKCFLFFDLCLPRGSLFYLAGDGDGAGDHFGIILGMLHISLV